MQRRLKFRTVVSVVVAGHEKMCINTALKLMIRLAVVKLKLLAPLPGTYHGDV